MRKASPYYNLAWRVDCMRPPAPAQWFETIAAFNSETIALAYAADCRAAKPSDWTYRVMTRKNRLWVEVPFN